jgi:pilus assembly protein CpaB
MKDRRLGRFTQLTRAIGWHRRLLAAGLAAGAVAAALQAAEPDPGQTVPVVTAARDLSGGATVVPEDIRASEVPPDLVPTGALSRVDAVVGRTLSGPVRAGEPLTDVRLVGPDLLAAWGDELVATPVRIADPGVVTLVQPGDVIDLLGAPTSGIGETAVVASGVPVLAVPAQGDQGMLAEGALLVIAGTSDQVASLAHAAVTSRLSIALRSH